MKQTPSAARETGEDTDDEMLKPKQTNVDEKHSVHPHTHATEVRDTGAQCSSILAELVSNSDDDDLVPQTVTARSLPLKGGATRTRRSAPATASSSACQGERAGFAIGCLKDL